MKIVSNLVTLRSSLMTSATALLAFALLLTLAPSPTLKADPVAAPAPAVKLPALPVTSKFDKVKDADKGPYALHVKNTSKAALKLSAKVLLAVAMHADSKARLVPAQVIEPGKSLTIPGLVAQDKVIITADAFAPLELTVP